METSTEYQLTLRQQLLREAGSLNEPQLLAEALVFVRQLHTRDTPPRPGSPAAVMQYFGTLAASEADKMQAIIDQEFSTIEHE